jgi:hypothetical protein
MLIAKQIAEGLWRWAGPVALVSLALFWGGRAGAAMTNAQTVFLILMDDHNWSQIQSNPAAPYINGTLLPMASHATQYFNPPHNHPSLPNYLWLEAGTNFHIRNDGLPHANHRSATNHFVTLLERAGISWTSYQEDICGCNCPLVRTNKYVPKHNPMVYFDDVTGSNDVQSAYCIAHIRPLSELAGNLASNTVARYNFITPDLCDDMYGGCKPVHNRIAQGDDWLAQNIPPILASTAYQSNGVIIITWDEASHRDGPIGLIVLSPLAAGGGYANSIHYTHSSTLLSLQEIFGVTPLLGDAVNATDLSDLFTPVHTLIPPDRLINWTPGTYVGVPGGIPTTRTNSLLAITVYGADSNGVSDSSGSINSALEQAPGNTAVFLPAGTYILSNGLYLANNVTLRGATNTVLMAATSVPISHSASDNGVDYGDPSGGQTVTGGLLKGSTNITVASPSGFGVGRLVNLSRAWWGNVSSKDQYDLPVIVNVSGHDRNSFQGWPETQMLRVTGLTSTNLFVWPPLYFDMTGRVCVVNSASAGPPSFAGVEDLSIDCSHYTTSYAIQFEQAYGDWIKNVHVLPGDNQYVVMLLSCLQCEVRDSYIDASTYSGPDAFGLGVQNCSGLLVENNTIFQNFPSIEVFSGSSGNVFGYNFCYNTNGDWAIDSNHGPHNRFNLYEGNIANDFKSDGYFGSESHCIQYRNWFHGQYLADTYVLDRFSRQFSMVGNILGGLSPSFLTSDGTVFGLPNLGDSSTDDKSAPPWSDWGNWLGPYGFQELDTNVVASLVRVGNFNYFTNAIPPSESLNGQTLSNSLYLTSEPSWWTNGGYSVPWPPFDPTSPNPSFGSIPAGYRYLNAN